ncbi:MAG: carbon starvation protein A [Candidatus Firestonebacteria bacterium]|nr:carbon starvation protein A [Candidatus Firestonebacteria bacterium]
MNSVIILILGIIVYYLGIKVYAQYIDEKIIKSDPKRATPARMYADGVDFMPTPKNILFGYQFKSIAGAAPILGPIIAIKWGWLPGLVWILLGTLFIGWVQDYTSAVVSIRNDGKTFGSISYSLISPRARTILLFFIYLYLLLIAAAFTDIVAKFMSNNPSLPLSIIVLALDGMLVGFMIYRSQFNLVVVTIIGLGLFYGAMILGNFIPINFSDPSFNLIFWAIFALAFSFLGSILPIWSFVQPINYLGFFIIFIGMIGIIFGIVVGHPNLSAPAITGFTVDNLPLWPMLFVTIACGATSGWHSIVSSTGTSRQLEKETDTRPVAGGAMFLEMILALLALIIVSINTTKVPPPVLFGNGMGDILHYLGLPVEWGKAYGPVMIVILAITILHLVIRFMRIATNELAGKAFPLLKNQIAGTMFALILTFILVYTGTFNYIWVLFGSANQLMASLALLICSIWLVSQKKPSYFTFYPMIFMYVTTMVALIITDYQLLKQAINRIDLAGKPLALNSILGNWFAGIIGITLFISAVILAYDGIKAFIRYRKELFIKIEEKPNVSL